MVKRVDGFSLAEVMVAMVIVLVVFANVIALLSPSQSSFLTQSEAADVQQRLRVAADTLYKDLVMAGAGAYQGAGSGSLGYYFAPILPYRKDSNEADLPGTFKTDTITLIYVPQTAAQTTIATPVTASSTDVSVNAEPGCPVADPACGFKAGMTTLVYNRSGAYDTFSVTGVQSSTLTLRPGGPPAASVLYPANAARMVQATAAVYFLKTDAVSHSSQLMYYDGGAGGDVPVLDHIVDLRFEYYGDPQPPALTGKLLSDPTGPWTTYGPPPPELGQQIPGGGYPAGENCVFTVDAGTGLQTSRLPTLGTGALVPLGPTQLDGSDGGPWCPGPADANRWDADLLRIRSVAVTVRVESANAALRGPASILFAHGGTAAAGTRWVPDQQVRFQVTPRNLILGVRP